MFKKLQEPRRLRALIFSEMGILCACALLMPSRQDSDVLGPRFFISIADVRNMALQSDFPFALSIAYGGALVGGVITAAIVAMLMPPKPNDEFLKATSSSFGRSARPIFLLPFLLVVIATPFFLELTVREGQFSYRFFEWVVSSRLGLLVWAEGVFLFVFSALLWSLLQIKGKFSGERK